MSCDLKMKSGLNLWAQWYQKPFFVVSTKEGYSSTTLGTFRLIPHDDTMGGTREPNVTCVCMLCYRTNRLVCLISIEIVAFC